MRIPASQILFAAILGTVTGVYIWKPSLEKYAEQQRQLEAPHTPPPSVAVSDGAAGSNSNSDNAAK
eukprot:m.21255 g.21255  ORF g.21255 m.21255 type:complete len:66 (+) comp3910_c0_seq1:45-242(+)